MMIFKNYIVEEWHLDNWHKDSTPPTGLPL
jgi:hypothetical protein